jgi:hypothetical protein
MTLPDLQKMLGQVKQIQEQLQANLERINVEAAAGGGLVSVRMNGQKQLLEVRIDPAVQNDREMLQTLVVAAVNEAARKVDAELQAHVSSLAGNLAWLRLPGLLG